ncbi:toll-like receptor Tollo isoform X1 [Daphnia pulicaria]|uniref:toll-like receptor Tollo isoform X1 n=1 Tax=Daphnia pulicaria TaxID=35523 RepID=UPI001EEA6113|nr:toll-like receptor Tollo isoform X1 [Daphnia pulicaria]
MNLVTFFFIIAAVGCLVVFSSATLSPTCQWNRAAGTGRRAEKDKNSLDCSSPSIQLRYKGNEFHDIEAGRIPAWVGPDGLMRVPSALPYLTSSDIASSSPEALSHGTNNSPYGFVVLPEISSSQTDDAEFEGSNEQEDDEEEESSFRRLLKLAPLLSKKESQTTGRNLYEFSPSTDREDVSFAELLVPTATHADGSDIFQFETYDPSNSYPTEFDASDIDLPSGCYIVPVVLEDDPPGYLICNDSTMTKIPSDLPRQVALSIFEMNNTNVETLASGDFRQLDVVTIKFDSNAQLVTIELGAFDGVTSLHSLYIEHSSISTLNWQVFDGLDGLEMLSLKANLINLTEMFKTTPGDEETCALPDLHFLDLSENPLRSLNQYAFWQLRESPIMELSLKSCGLAFIHQDAFEPLSSLKHVDFYNNPKLVSIFSHEMKAPSLPPSIFKLGLGNNRFVQKVPLAMLQNISRSLVQINLSINFYFLLSENVWPSIEFDNLTTLILESCSISVVNETAFQNMPKLIYLYMGKNQLTQVAPYTFPQSLQLLSVRQNPQMSGLFTMSKDNFAGMTNLQWLDMNSMSINSKNLSADAFQGLNNLWYLQMRNSGLSEIPSRFFSSLTKLVVLDLGENSISTLPPQFSVGLTNTLMLFLDHCSLDFPAEIDYNYQPFRGMKNLSMLFLSKNSINQFTPNLVANLSQLSALHLNGNQLHTWEFGTTAYMPHYAAIAVSNNKIQFLPNQTYEEFSRVAAIDLSDNALICNCQTLDLLRLANSTNTTVLNWNIEGAYTCTDTSTEPFVIKQIPLMSEEEFECKSEIIPSTVEPNPDENTDTVAIVSSVVGAMIVVLIFLAAVASCYFRRKKGQRKWFDARNQLTIPNDGLGAKTDDGDKEFEFDAFISFNEQDRSWVYTHLVPQLESSDPSDSGDCVVKPFRLCIHDRDFTVGQRITENIIENIAKSRKVIIVLSRGYVESKWCQFELHLSQHRLLESERRDALVLILLEDVPKQQQNAGLRYLMSTRTYLAWRSDQEGQKLFWLRLRQVLTARNRDSNPVVTLSAST